MTERLIIDEKDRKLLIRFIENHKLPCTVTIVDGRRRSVDQNRLQFLWANEISQQTGDTAEEVRAFCKLMFGVPILREASEEFRVTYDAHIAPMTHERKMKFIQGIDLEVTRSMTMKQMKQYLDDIYHYYTENGLELTAPDWQGLEAA